MGLQINFRTDEMAPGEALGLARLLESVSPGVLADALGDTRGPRVTADVGETRTVTLPLVPAQTLAEAGADYMRLAESDHAGGVLIPAADLSNLPPPVAPTGAVPIPPAPPSGVVSATPPAPAASPADRDVNGLPWDGRIHASTRVRNADGSWRAKRAVHPETVRIVEAELRQNAAAPAPGVSVPVPPPPAASSDTPQPIAPAGTPADGTPPPPPTGTPATTGASPSDAPPPPPPAPATLSGPQLFARYMERVTAAQTGGLVTTADVASIATGLGLVGTAGLLQRPDLVPQAEAALDALLASRG